MSTHLYQIMNHAFRIHALLWISLSILLGPDTARAEFVTDEFNQSSLNHRWLWADSNPSGSTWTLTGSHLRMHVCKGGDHFFTVDRYPYLQQDAPTGSNWEVETKIDNFDPRGRMGYNKAGLMLWQDNDHWMSLAILTDEPGRRRGVQCYWQADPVAARLDSRYSLETHIWDITSPTIHLKIRKSSDGYLGLISEDGQIWTVATPLLRNPQNSPGGEFRPEKIRLFQSGAILAKEGKPDPADFDYVRVHRVPQPSPEFRPDDFESAERSREIWRYHPGLLPGSLELSGGKALLTTTHEQDQWNSTDTVSHLYQNAPTGASWSIVAQVGPGDLRGQPNYCGYGIVLWQDQNHWILISSLRDETGRNTVEWAAENANSANYRSGKHLIDPWRRLPLFLRITKQGSLYTCAFSHNRVQWTETPEGGVDFGTPLQDAQLRLFVKRPTKAQGPPTLGEFYKVEEEAAPPLARKPKPKP